MFTGIVLDIGRIASMETRGDDLRLAIAVEQLSLDKVSLGDSIAVNGVCLTVVELSTKTFYADVSIETLDCTTLGKLEVGSPVNLEPALTPSTALGGHWVSGHVDGIAHIKQMRADGRSTRVDIEVPATLVRYIVAKGSVTLDGVSLTVNSVSGTCFGINIVPHTLEKTIFSEYHEGSAVNIEVDIIARYLEKLLAPAGDRDTGVELD